VSDFRDWGEGWPTEWRDVGKRVELMLADGSCIIGTLEAEEFFTGDDEIPVFTVRADDGRELSFVDHEKWRYVDVAA
jgi:hypothetical protein